MFKPFNKQAMIVAIEHYFTDPNCKAFIAEQEGINIGYILCFIKQVNENAFHYALKTLYIDQICVLTKYQRTGAGKLLMERAETLAGQHAIHKIELDHWSANTVAAAYFRKKGYELYKERLFKPV